MLSTKRKSDAGELLTTTTREKKAKTKKTATTSTATMPSAYTSQQKAEMAQFQSVTGANSSVASKLLKSSGWNTQNAINSDASLNLNAGLRMTSPLTTATPSFFNSSSNSGPNPTRRSLEKLFDPYRSSPRDSPNELDIEGTTRLLTDLQIGLEDIASLIFFEAVSSPQIGVITREGFVDAFADGGADSIPKIRNIILARRSEITRDKALFKRVYNHTFSLLLEERKKAIDLDQAEGFWRVLFSPDGLEWKGKRGTPWLDWWVEFLNAKWGKAINKDLWRQTLTFAEETQKDENLGFWNEESSWPSVIDEFVEWVKVEKRHGAGGGDDMDVE